MTVHSHRSRAGLLALAALIGRAGGAQAQGTGDGFLFKRPGATLTVRGGFALAKAGSDVFSFTTSELTVDRRDFSSGLLGADLSVRVSRRVDLAFGLTYSGRKTASEFRDWVDQDDLPIRQTTTFRRLPITASVKAYVTPRGRSIGRFAWIPARYAVYAGVGGGAMWYEFLQTGDFIDFQTLEVFPDRFESKGWAPVGQAMAGFEFSLTPRLGLSAEARYTLATANLSNDFEGFDPIDLSGASATMGVALRF